MNKTVAVDVETTGLSTWKGDRPFSVAFYWEDGKTQFWRWKVDPFTRKVAVDPKDVAAIRKVLEDPKVVKVFHNSKFDVRMLESIGIKVAGRIEDTLFATFVVKNDLPTYGLKYLGEKVLGIAKDDEKALKEAVRKARLAGKKLGWKLAEATAADYWMAPPEILKRYNLLDVERTMLLWCFLQEKLTEVDGWPIYNKEMELWKVTYEIETTGVNVNRETVLEEIVKHEEAIRKNYTAIVKAIGHDINLNSPKQMSKLFYEELDFECKEFTETGAPSVNSKALLHVKHPVADLYIAHQASEHAIVNFFGKYRDGMVRETNGLWTLHPDFNQVGPITGRYSCRNPNLQNVANAWTTRSSVPIMARNPFCPRPGYTWYFFDYSQIELWIFALLSQEKLMLDALMNGRDIHTETANHVWGHGEDIVAKEKAAGGKSNTRGKAKMMNFGKIYGMGIGGAMSLIGCSKSEAKQYLAEYDAAFPTIQAFMNRYSRQAEIDGYIKSPYGRKYYIDPHFSYRAVNYLVQGSAADLIKEKMIETAAYLRRTGADAKIVMTIHDELTFEIKKSHATRNLLRGIKRVMEDHHGVFPCPKFKAEISKTETTWDKKHAIGENGEYD